MEVRSFSEDDLLKAVGNIQSFASVKKASDYVSGRVVIYAKDWFNRETCQMNTSVEDLLSVIGNGFRITIMANMDCTDTMQTTDIRIANKKDFRGILKFTPKNTLCVTVGTLGKNGYDGKEFSVFKLPILQRKDIVDCHSKEINDYLEYYNLLTNNKSLVCDKNKIIPKSHAELEICNTHLILCNCYEMLNYWYIGYDYDDCTYLIPVDIRDLKDALKNRDKSENGRKPILPTVINSFNKCNGSSVKTHTRMSDNGFDLFGEHFYFVLGRDALSITYHSDKHGKYKLNRDFDTGYEYRNGKTLIFNKKGVGIGVFNNNVTE